MRKYRRKVPNHKRVYLQFSIHSLSFTFKSKMPSCEYYNYFTLTMNIIVKISLLLLLLHVCCCRQRKNYLKCGQQLNSGEFLESGNGYYAVLQSDCNFVIYASKHFVARNSIWQSKTARTNCVNPRLVNQRDGNVVLFSNNRNIWSTNTRGSGTRCYDYVLQEDGNLVLYSGTTAVWNSQSAA